ncbi:hypothetical protein LCGC14_2696730, partial [marine sediment metagenome]
YRAYRERNRARIAEKNRLWRQNNPEKERARKQRQRTSGYESAYQRQYRQTAASKYSALRSRAQARGIGFDIDRETFTYWFNEQPHVCRYCHAPVSIADASRKRWLTIDRMDNKRPYVIGNITVCCYRCNLLKSDDISFTTMVEIGQLLYKEKHGKVWNGSEWACA